MIGVNLFVLGVIFNYLVALFRGRPVQQGLFGRPLFRTPIERQFGWMGLVTVLVGLTVAGFAVIMGVGSWDMTRLWLYGLSSAMMILLGVELMIFWVVLQVLDELNTQAVRKPAMMCRFQSHCLHWNFSLDNGCRRGENVTQTEMDPVKQNLGSRTVPRLKTANFPSADTIVGQNLSATPRPSAAVDILLVNPPTPDGGLWIRSQHRVGRRTL